jgi:transcriptional regulator with XRE-family HTH domain
MPPLLDILPARRDVAAAQTLNEIDVHLGRRLRRRRKLLGLTQQALAETCGVCAQQIQKYECAAIRMTAVRLWLMADVLQVPMSYFYDGLSRAQRERLELEDQAPVTVAMVSVETRDLLHTYYSLGEVPRRRLLDLARAMTANADD